MQKMRWFLVASGLVLSACPTRSEFSECEDDSACTGVKPFCDLNIKECVQCKIDEECGCHEFCETGVCTVLGTDKPEFRLNAHGNWTGTPGVDSGEQAYLFQDLCEISEDCGFGGSCNPLTKSCFRAADFGQNCNDANPCPAGPNGEILVCNPESNTCIPTSVCKTNNNCCGIDASATDSDFVCEPVTATCQLVDPNGCTPPDTIISTSPFEPKVTEGCVGGKFCSPVGECVQCLSTADCGDNASGLKCDLATKTCVSSDFCRSAADCNDGLACDTTNQACTTKCVGDSDCDDAEYCRLDIDEVCRPRSELPCLADAFDGLNSDTEGNETVAEATANDATLMLPTVLDQAVVVGEFSLCAGDVDYYQLSLLAGDEITVDARSNNGLVATMFILAPDGTTPAATGGAVNGGLLQFVANADGVYFLNVSTFGGTPEGDYELRLTKSLGTPCIDPLERDEGNDSTPATARPLNGGALVAPMNVPAACTLSGTITDDHTVTCASSASVLCSGDVDFYIFEVPAGGRATTAISNFSGSNSVTTEVYGPFADHTTVSDDPSFRLAPLVENQSLVSAETESRDGGVFLLKVRHVSGAVDKPYQVQLSVDVPATVCAVDIYDLPAAANALDEPGLNDAIASGISVNTGANTVNGLSLCRFDEDLFAIGVDNGGTLEGLAPNRRVSLSVSADVGSPASDLTLALGTSPGDFSLAGSEDPQSPETEINIDRTFGQTYYAKVVSSNTEAVNYTLDVNVVEPPACAAEVPSDNHPLEAFDIDEAAWTSAGDLLTLPLAGQLDACDTDDDWFVVDVPEGFKAIARLRYDYNDVDPVDLGLALYDDSVSSESSVPGGMVLSSGLVHNSEIEGLGHLMVVGDGTPDDGLPATATASNYIQVYNRSGWPQFDYQLELELVVDPCAADAFESNGDANTAGALTLTRDSEESDLETAYLRALSECGTGGGVPDYDWFSIVATPGDVIEATAFYRPSEIDMTLRIGAPLDGPSSAIRKSGTDTNNDGSITVSYTVGDVSIDEVGEWFISPETRQQPSAASFDGSYDLEVEVRRICLDDALEPAVDTDAAPLPLDFAISPQQLCSDLDWYEINTTGAGTLTVCMTAEYDEADVDIVLADAIDGVVLANSATKEDLETFEYTLTGPSETVYLLVEQDSSFRPLANIEYFLEAKIGTGCSPVP